jgi:hypothetical protein
MSTRSASVSNQTNPYKEFFQRSLFHSWIFCAATIVLVLALFHGGIVLTRHRLDSFAVFLRLAVMLVPLMVWVKTFFIHRKIRRLTVGPQSSEMAVILQILAQTLVSTLLIVSILMFLALSLVENALQ